MKNLKMFMAALAVTVLSFVTGCSDQITSSGEQDFMSSENELTLEAGKQIDRPLFHTQIRLKPNRSYTFNSSNTGLISFNSVKAERINFPSKADANYEPCKDLKVFSVQEQKTELGCSNNSLKELKEIVVLNVSSSIIDVDIVLLGDKPPVKKTGQE